MKKLSFFWLLLAGFSASAQYGYRDSNRIGISGGINQFTLNTNDFDTSPGTGWQAGLSVRGNFYNDFDMVYGLQFSENEFSVKTDAGALGQGKANVKWDAAQIYLLLSYKFIENHLSAEIGPAFQFNGKLVIKDEDQGSTISGTNLTMKDIQDVSLFNFYPTVGLTAGVRHLRAFLYYQYGATNMLRKFEDNGGKLTGHGGILGANITVYL
jgi:hypothetical protein